MNNLPPFPVELPEEYLQLAVELKLYPADISERFVRGGGPGGQKINKTSSCVFLRHQPTGIEVKCQKHREQSKNRLSAWKLLIRKIEAQAKGAKSADAQRIFKIRKQKARRSRKAKEKMLEAKRRHAELKRSRQGIGPEGTVLD